MKCLVGHNLVYHLIRIVASQCNADMIIIKVVEFWNGGTVTVASMLCFSRHPEVTPYMYLGSLSTPHRA